MDDPNEAPRPPVELVEALEVTEGALENWAQQPVELRRLYSDWVAEPRRGRERVARAQITASQAASGLLPQAVQRPGIFEALLNLFQW